MFRLSFHLFAAWCLLAARPGLAQELFRPAEAAADATSTMRAWNYSSEQGAGKIVAEVTRIEKGQAVFVDQQSRQHSVPLERLTEADRREALLRVIGGGVVRVFPLDVFGQERGWASGFVVRNDGLLLTNYHVVRGAADVEVRFRGEKKRVKARLLSVDRAVDVAFLKVDKLPEKVRPIAIAASESPAVGSTVWTIGHPQNLPDTVSWGKVNAVRPTKEAPQIQQSILGEAPDSVRWIQTDAVIEQGSSGSPLLDEKGRALGMNTFQVGVQLGFALQLDGARDAFKRIDIQKPLELPLPPAEGENAFGWYCRELAPIVKQAREEFSQLARQRGTLPPEKLVPRVFAANRKYRHQYLAFARKQPQGWPGLQALYYAAGLSLDGTPDDHRCIAEITELLQKHHATRREMTAVVQTLVNVEDDQIRAFFRALRKASPHQDVRATAALGLAQNLFAWLANTDSMDLKLITARRQEAANVLSSIQADFKDDQYRLIRQLAQQLQLALNAQHLGKTAPATTGVDIDGQGFALKDYRNKVVLLDFFGNWCPWCIKMYPEQRKLVKELDQKPFALLGVNTDNQRVLGEIIESGEITWRCWADGPQGPLQAAWGVNDFPTAYLIDKQGVVRRRFVGTPDMKDVRKAIDKLLAERVVAAGR